MYQAIIWGTGHGYNQYINAVKYQELLGNIKILGITGKDEIYSCLDGYPFIPITEIKPDKVDFVIITSDLHFHDISEEAQNIGFTEDKIIGGSIFFFPNLDFKKYAALLRSNITIIANNCWGGIAYHMLGMKFLSPFINMFELEGDYIRLLKNLRYYLSGRLEFARYAYEPVLKRNYPVCKLEDIELHFNHYVSMEEIEDKWYSRCQRINWDNLFIMMHTEKEEFAEQFQTLDYQKKICFVPFESSLDSAYTLRLARHPLTKDIPFSRLVLETGWLKYSDYDIVDLLLTGKVAFSRTDHV